MEEPPSWAEMEHRARARRRLLYIGILVALVVAALAALVWNADSRYRAGRLALEQGRYGEAVANFTAARVLFVSYRDADALRKRAEDELTRTVDTAQREIDRQAKVTGLLAAADRLLASGANQGALDKLRAAAAVLPGGPLPLDAEGQTLATALVQSLRDGAAGALAEARWAAAGLQAAALLILAPGDPQAERFADRADQGVRLEAKVEAARAAARRRDWKEALRIARAVLAERRDFPGASAVVADALAALAPKPKPKPTSTPAPAPTPAPPAPQPTQPPPP